MEGRHEELETKFVRIEMQEKNRSIDNFRIYKQNHNIKMPQQRRSGLRRERNDPVDRATRGIHGLDSERGDRGARRKVGRKEGERRKERGRERKRRVGMGSWRGAHREKRNEGMARVLTPRTHGQFAQREKICIEQFSPFSLLFLLRPQHGSHFQTLG